MPLVIGEVPANKRIPASSDWINFIDSADVTSPRRYPTGASTVICDSSATVDTTAPAEAPTWWNSVTNRFDPGGSEAIGAAWVISIRFKAKPTVIDSGMELVLDIGGSQGVIFGSNAILLNKGAGEEHQCTVTFQGYSLGTFVANKGHFQFICEHPVDIYDLDIYVQREFEAALT